jgi:hypothetical protein
LILLLAFVGWGVAGGFGVDFRHIGVIILKIDNL